MITKKIRNLIENLSFVFVASADLTGQPHIAIGENVTISDNTMLVFENWFCPSTLQNIACNTHVSVVAVEPVTGKGFQMLGTVIRNAENTFLNGNDPNAGLPDAPQVLTRFTVKVEKVLEFTSGIHSDIPIVE